MRKRNETMTTCWTIQVSMLPTNRAIWLTVSYYCSRGILWSLLSVLQDTHGTTSRCPGCGCWCHHGYFNISGWWMQFRLVDDSLLVLCRQTYFYDPYMNYNVRAINSDCRFVRKWRLQELIEFPGTLPKFLSVCCCCMAFLACNIFKIISSIVQSHKVTDVTRHPLCFNTVHTVSSSCSLSRLRGDRSLPILCFHLLDSCPIVQFVDCLTNSQCVHQPIQSLQQDVDCSTHTWPVYENSHRRIKITVFSDNTISVSFSINPTAHKCNS